VSARGVSANGQSAVDDATLGTPLCHLHFAVRPSAALTDFAQFYATRPQPNGREKLVANPDSACY
jgi:hypothetical protein